MPRHLFLILLAVSGALISVLVIGFEFPVYTNAYHIPYVLDYADEPQFAQDAYYQSLRGYVSGFWFVLRGIADEGNIRNLFLALHYVSRALAFIAILLVISELGTKNRRHWILATLLLSSTSLFSGFSGVGHAELFPPNFTHSALASSLILFTFLLLKRGRIVIGFALIGVIFDINAFIGAWCGCVACGVLLAGVQSGASQSLVTRAARLLPAILTAILVASPVLAWIVSGLVAQGPVTFDYKEYIRAFFPIHFLIDAANPWRVFSLGCMVVATYLAFHHTKTDRYWVHVYTGFLITFVVGAALPYVFNHRFVFCLHFLRVAGVLQLFSVIVLTRSLLATLTRRDAIRDLSVYQILVLLALGSAEWILILLAFLLLYGKKDAVYANRVGAVIAGVLALGAVLPVDILPTSLVDPERPASVHVVFIVACLFLFAVTTFGERPSRSGWVWLAAALAGALGSHAMGKSWDPSPLLIVMFAMALPVVYFWRPDRPVLRWIGLAPLLGALLLFLTLPALLLGTSLAKGRAELRTVDREWLELTAWVRRQSLEEPVLISPWEQSEKNAPLERTPGFQLAARAPIWVNQKQGAAVLWAPSFHAQWFKRYREVSQLKGPKDYYDYARRNQIRYFIVKSTEEIRFEQATLLYATDHFKLFQMLSEPNGPDG